MRLTIAVNVPAYKTVIEKAEVPEVPGLKTTTKRRVPDGRLLADVVVEINERLVHQLAEKAARAASRRAVLGSGCVVAKAKNLRRTP